ncbi:hypothetical protein OEA41_003419 [Lepraria neglecta]|uniref:Uncharacterized protein n=1 Tax=Lepraria neglecta TaxID=209136 RepID=A0AAD9Z4A5_9LECA|nr:hypothetical protein OEA41_003419 [Lepraria neglecta]
MVTISRNLGADHDVIAAPANEALRYLDEPTQLNESFTFPSIYRGDPNDEIDAAWSKITDIGAMRISEEELEKLNPLFAKSAVRCPEKMGGGYMGSLEVFHQLHCVIAEPPAAIHTHPEYYKMRIISWEDPEDTVRTHIDVGAMTYNWVTVRDAPWPNFNTWHKCMDFDKVLKWGLDHQVPSKGEKMRQTARMTVLPTPP